LAPVTVFNVRALASLVTVAGNALNKRLTAILNALVQVKEDESDDELQSAVGEAHRAIFTSISDIEGLNILMMILIEWYVSHPFTRMLLRSNAEGLSMIHRNDALVPMNCSPSFAKYHGTIHQYIVLIGFDNWYLH
jgi:hypothetical protein